MRAARERMDVPARDLAWLAGVPASTWCYYERGRVKEPSFVVVALIESVLELEPGTLLIGDAVSDTERSAMTVTATT